MPEWIGNYKVVKELGRGSMGTVYLAQQESLGRDLAIKLMAAEFTRDQEFVERFKREGRIAAKLRHPNIVQVFDYSDQNGLYFIAMEYLGSKNLKEYLDDNGGKLSIEESLRIADQLLDALEHAHKQGVVHRDVKPANILVTDSNDVALTDFSIAHIKSAVRLTQTGSAVGTPEYMAPEQFDAKNIDARADLYAVGILLYQMLTGINPFHGESIGEVMKAQLFKEPEPPQMINPDIPKPLGMAIIKALKKNPAERFESAAEMRAAIKPMSAPVAAAGSSMDQFLADVASGKISLDDANMAREKVKEAIDRGYRKNLTFMMVDLAGSSKIKVPNQTLHADRAFRDYRATINSVLKKYGCMSFEWAGDGAICIFNTPLPAVEAALEVQAMVDDVGARHPDLPDKLRARIGVNTGEVYLDPRRGLGEFASRTVDQAGHLEKDCPVGEVHVSQATMEMTRTVINYEPVGVNRDQVMVYRAVPRKPAAVLADTSSKKLSGAPKVKVSLVASGPVPLLSPSGRHCGACGEELHGATSCPKCSQAPNGGTGVKNRPPSTNEPAKEAPAAQPVQPVQDAVALTPEQPAAPVKPKTGGWTRFWLQQGPFICTIAGFFSFMLGLPALLDLPGNVVGLQIMLALSSATCFSILILLSMLLIPFMLFHREGFQRVFAQSIIFLGLTLMTVPVAVALSQLIEKI